MEVERDMREIFARKSSLVHFHKAKMTLNGINSRKILIFTFACRVCVFFVCLKFHGRFRLLFVECATTNRLNVAV